MLFKNNVIWKFNFLAKPDGSAVLSINYTHLSVEHFTLLILNIYLFLANDFFQDEIFSILKKTFIVSFHSLFTDIVIYDVGNDKSLSCYTILFHIENYCQVLCDLLKIKQFYVWKVYCIISVCIYTILN